MKKESWENEAPVLRIVFMGTPHFAVPVLESLWHSKHEVVAVVTGVDTQSGRNQVWTQTPVKMRALELGANILQPEKLRHPEFVAALEALKPDLIVVVAFKMLPEMVWSLPRLGSMNLHASLLPNYRGAAPIHWAIINGETETGLSTFVLAHAIDTGDMLLQEKMQIGPDETTGELHDRMAQMAGPLVLRSIEEWQTGKIERLPQPELAEVKLAPKLFKEHGRLNWALPAAEVHNWVRGLNPAPGAHSLLNGKQMKILKTIIGGESPEELGQEVGDVWISKAEKAMWVRCGGGTSLRILELQPESRKAVAVREWVNGWNFAQAMPRFS